MLSILIPTYNYSTLKLVQELHKQATSENIKFEILVLDDASNNLEIKNENEAINLLSNCSFSCNEINIGRAANLNKLVKKSHYNNCLLLEADAFPENKTYIKKYLEIINNKIDVAFGGVIYKDKKPKSNSLLRWIYGHKRESKSLDLRLKKPNKLIFSWNLLISKQLILKFPFDESIKKYGFEDLIFLKKLENNNVKIHQFNNNCFHNNEETSMVFIEKYNSSLQNLKLLLDCKKLNYDDTSLSYLYLKIKNLKLQNLIIWIFNITEKLLLKNLISKNCSLVVFDFYKLGYFCKINSK